MLGNTYVKLGETGMGAEQLKLAHTLKLEDDEIFASLCEGLYADKKFDDLNRALRERTIDRGRMQDWALVAKYAERLGDQDEAQRAWLTAAKVDGGKSAIPQLGLARLYAKVGDTARARQRIAMAYFCDPLNGEVVAAAKAMGEIPGPTFGVMPEERRMAQMPVEGEMSAPKVTGVETRDGK
jgi:predicted Zn-dependent protease